MTITRDMSMMTTEVTQKMWKELSGGTNRSYFSDCDDVGGDACPVEQVDWYAAAGYANALSVSKSLPPCYDISGCHADDWKDGLASSCSVRFANTNDPLSCTGYRLPTEAEWEYAYRAGSKTTYYNGDLEVNLDEIAWYAANSGGKTHTVAGKKPNLWGLFDMAGNVREWTWDWYGDYPGPVADDTGPVSGTNRTLRGGSWQDDMTYASASRRAAYNQAGRVRMIGFRLIRTLP